MLRIKIKMKMNYFKKFRDDFSLFLPSTKETMSRTIFRQIYRVRSIGLHK